jgi:SNF2 family DNA or RNA helicase
MHFNLPIFYFRGPLQNSVLELFALLHFVDPIEFSDPESESKSFSGLKHSEVKISQIHDLLKPLGLFFLSYLLNIQINVIHLLFV